MASAAHRPVSHLLEGSLSRLIDSRRDVIERMAIDLIHYGALASDDDAAAALLGNGYGWMDIGLYAGEARMVAYQIIVAREMSQS